MKIIDINGVEITSPNLELGRLELEKEIVQHVAIQGVQEQWHYETVAVYPNGGMDVQKVIDIPGVEPKEAWEEELLFYRYIPYTEEELAEMEANRKPSTEEQIAELREALDLLLSGVTE